MLFRSMSVLKDISKAYVILGHCIERSTDVLAMQQWQQLFSEVGLTLTVADVGCCGMAGAYGYQREHRKISRQLYDISWRSVVQSHDSDQVLVTGLSCRSQIKRFSGLSAKHPLQILYSVLS